MNYYLIPNLRLSIQSVRHQIHTQLPSENISNHSVPLPIPKTSLKEQKPGPYLKKPLTQETFADQINSVFLHQAIT